jgi:hypothetical protein
MTNNNSENEVCCPPFEPSTWDDKVIEWDNKMFIKDKVWTFLYMPFGFGKVMRKLDEKVRSSNATIPDWLCLSDHTSSWNMNIYLAVDKSVPDAEMVTFTGKYFAKVYEGPFQNTGKWTKDFEAEAKRQDYNIKKMYMWYTTCPKCAKKYGNNYVVLFGEI